jgi:cyanophycinase
METKVNSSGIFLKSFAVLLLLSVAIVPSGNAKWKYYRTGAEADSQATPRGGFALMGGGGKQDPAFKFLCDRANGGDFLILRASGDDDYINSVDKEIKAMCPLNSASTILFTDREDSADPKIIPIIDQAESIFFAGGDQSNYVRFWQDTPVQDALNRHIAAGKPIGGSSAGLAILGQYVFSSMIDTIYSKDALANPYGNEVTLSRDFLQIPLLTHTITDTHFVKRDRLGRLMVFLARILQDGWDTTVHAIAVDEDAAVLVERDGASTVVGGKAYFMTAATPPTVCRYHEPLTFGRIAVHRAQAGETFDLKTWKGKGGDDYTLKVEKGVVTAPDSNHGLY